MAFCGNVFSFSNRQESLENRSMDAFFDDHCTVSMAMDLLKRTSPVHREGHSLLDEHNLLFMKAVRNLE